MNSISNMYGNKYINRTPIGNIRRRKYKRYDTSVHLIKALSQRTYDGEEILIGAVCMKYFYFPAYMIGKKCRIQVEFIPRMSLSSDGSSGSSNDG